MSINIANGFLLQPQLNVRSIQVLPSAGGWMAVIEKFRSNFIPTLRQYSNRMFVLLIDFDREQGRLKYVKQQIPDDLSDRVFVLGVLSNPEELRRILGQSLECIGETLAANCFDNIDGLWGHDLLKHNKTELERMSSCVKPFLFNQDR